jgi:DNA gyrase/topoisomerase IV subunit B
VNKISEEEFREYISLTPDADVIEDRLCTIASTYLNESQYLSAIIAKKAQAQRQTKAKKAELYEDYRQLKATDKTWTETAIDSAISKDPEVVDLVEKESRLDVAIDLRKARIEAIRMLNGNLQLLGRSILNEKFGVQ